MDRASQPARTGLTDRLAPDIARINFYRFCQLLEQRQQNAPLGSTASARLPILSGVSTRLLLNSSVMHSVWPPVAVCYVLVGLPSWKPEKRAYGFVVRNFAVSVIALSASGEEPSCGKPTPSVAEQEGQLIETEATGAPQKHHHTLNQ